MPIIIILELTMLVTLAVISDIKSCKIKNGLTAGFMAAGLITNCLFFGPDKFVDSAAGAIIPFFILFILYYLKILGAGDIKLFCAIGAIGGASFVPGCMVYAFLSGGVIAAAVMLFRRNAPERVKYFIQHLKACFLTKSLLPYYENRIKNDSSAFRFSYAIACGTIITAIVKF